MKHEIVQKDYAQLCNAVKREAPEKEVIPFSPDEIAVLWDNINEVPFADMILGHLQRLASPGIIYPQNSRY